MINQKLRFAILSVAIASVFGTTLGVVIVGAKGLWLFPTIFLAVLQVSLIFILYHTLRSFRRELPLLKKVLAGCCVVGIFGGFVTILAIIQHGLILRLT